MKLQTLQEKQKNISNIGRITSAIQTISMVKKQQASKAYNKTLISLSVLRKEVNRLTFSDFNQNALHIVFSVDKKFCRDFIYLASNYVSKLQYDQNDTFISFGKHAIESLKNSNAEIKVMEIILSLEDAYSAAILAIKHLMSGREIIMHFYSVNESKFINSSVFPGIPSLKDKNICTLYMAYYIYVSAIETSMIENSSRAVAMAQASDTCKNMQHELKLQYNRLRQEKITLEMSEIIGGLGI